MISEEFFVIGLLIVCLVAVVIMAMKSRQHEAAADGVGAADVPQQPERRMAPPVIPTGNRPSAERERRRRRRGR